MPESLGVPNSHYLKAYQRHRTEPFDIFLYQLEDGSRSRFVRASIGIMPGITWFHDLFFQDLGPEATHTSPWESSIQQILDPSVPFPDRAVAPHQLWPRAFRELSLSPVSLFSSQWALAESRTMISSRIESHLGAHRCSLLPVPVEKAEAAPLPARDVLRVVTPAGPGHEGRAHKFLPALKALNSPWHLTWLLAPDERGAAEALVREFDLSPRVTLQFGRTPAAWAAMLRSAHVALHLHTSSFGHLAPFLHMSLASGRLAVVSDMAQGEDIPASAAMRIIPGISEGMQLVHALRAAQEIDILQATEPARRYVDQHHSPHAVAARLSTLLREAAPLLASPMAKWEHLYARAHDALMSEVRELVGGANDAGLDPFARLVSPAIGEISMGVPGRRVAEHPAPAT